MSESRFQQYRKAVEQAVSEYYARLTGMELSTREVRAIVARHPGMVVWRYCRRDDPETTGRAIVEAEI